MKITIDTKRDSKEEIMYAIELIERLTGHQLMTDIDNKQDSEELQNSEQEMFNIFDSEDEITEGNEREKKEETEELDFTELEQY